MPEKISTKPKFPHDCERCIPLGSWVSEKGQEFDLYFCRQMLSIKLPTVIARFGPKGWQYISGMELADEHPALWEARRRAFEMGLIKARTRR